MKTKYRVEPTWHVALAVLAAIFLQLVLKSDLTVTPKFIMAALEVLLLIGLFSTRPSDETKQDHKQAIRRLFSIGLIALISVTNIVSLVLVTHALLITHSATIGRELIISAIAIYATNIIIFGLWYWELDGGGPGGRGSHLPPIDFLFPQLSTPESVTKEPNWSPTFLDYLFVSITNATAFSPTDALPLTHRAKALMSVQAIVSLTTIAVVAARAINILV